MILTSTNRRLILWAVASLALLAAMVVLLLAPPAAFAQDAETSSGICDRTAQVRDAILNELSDKNIERTCSAVTDDDLAEVQSLFLGNRFSFFSDSPKITELKAGDFQGLSNLHWLTLDDHGLSALPDGIFDDLSELTRLDLSENGLTSLRDGVFDDLSSLGDLKLRHNNLTSLPDGVFDDLSNLNTLYLDNNKLTSLPDDVFDGLSSLRLLDLGRNDLTALPEDAFDGLSSLETLHLDRNNLNSLHKDVFDGLLSLEKLGLDYNNPITLPEGVFEDLSSLTNLGVSLKLPSSSSEAESPGPFDDVSGLERLSLGGSSLGTQPADLFQGLSELEYLYLGNSELSSVPPDLFDGLGNLVSLNLGNNSLSSLPEDVFDGLSNLISLYLKDNNLTTLPENIFDGLSTLESLYLEDNNLTTLPENIFDGLSTLESLYLEDNNLTSLPGGVFDGLAELKHLNLFYNKMTALPVGMFEGLSKLETLDLTRTPVTGHGLSRATNHVFTVNLVQQGSDQFVVQIAQGAPLNTNITLSAEGGTLSADTVTIAAGSTSSAAVSVSAADARRAQVTVSVASALFDGWTEPYEPSGTCFCKGFETGAGAPLTILVPTITGNVQVGQTLTANTSGLEGTTFSFQWITNGGTGDGDIPNASSSTYMVDTADEGKTVKVRVTLSGGSYDGQSVTSGPTGPVISDTNNPPTDLPSISGTFQVGQRLTVDTSAIADEDGLSNVSYSYQWIRSDTDIEGAANSTYTLVTADQGKTIKVRVSFTDDADNEEMLTSAATVVAKPNTAPTGLPTISGTPEVGETLTVSKSDIADEDGLSNASYSYQWIAGGSDISGANGSSYTLTSSEQGQTIQVRVSFTDDADNAESLTSVATVTVAPQSDNTEEQAAVWSADMLVVEYTSVSIGAASPGLFFNIGGSAGLQIESLWSYTPSRDIRLAFKDAVPDAKDLTLHVGDLALPFPAGSSGQSSFKWTDVDVDWEDGETISVRIVQTSAPVEPAANTPATGAPTISGTEQVDETLTADTADIADEDGLDDVSHNYQWIRSVNGADTDIAGENDSTYTLVFADQGKTIKVRVSFTDDANNEETLTSEATVSVAAAPNRPATGEPTIGGTPQVEETLTANTSDIADEDGLASASYSYRWMADATDIEDATDSTYTPSVTDVGKAIKVRVSFTDDRNNAETRISVATATVLATVPTQPLSLTVAKGDQIQELDASWQAPSSNGGSTVTGYKVQWKEAADSWDTEADVSEATETGTTHTITSLTGGVEYAVRVIATNVAGDGPASTEARATPADSPTSGEEGTETVESDSTAAWTATLTVGVSGSGSETVWGYSWFLDGMGTLDERTYSEGDQTIEVMAVLLSNGFVAFNVRPHPSVDFVLTVDGTEFASADASEVKSQTLISYVWATTLDWAEDDRVALSLSLKDTDSAEQSEPAENTPATGLPTISGTPQVDQSLTASTSNIDDEDGLTNVSYRYQWIAGGTDIDGATGSSYELTSSEQGRTIQVRVTFTDDADNEETLTSEATVAVAAAANREATGQPTISGTPQVGQTLTADTANIVDQDGLTGVSYTYQWTAGGSDIDGATGSTHTLTASEQGQTIQVRVTFTDDADNEETLTSEATVEVTAAPVALTVSVTVSAPATHDGSSEFTFDIEFSEEFGLSYRTLKFHAFNVTGGSVERAQRTDKPSNIPWRITVKPLGTGDVIIELPATTDCDADGAICTGDGRKFSNSLSFTVSGPGG